MKVLRWGAVVAVVVALGWSALHRTPAASPLLGQPLPTLELAGLDGKAASTAALRGRVTVVNVWAAWCPPCLVELPSLEKLHRTLGAQGLVVVGITVDESAAEAQQAMREAGVTFPVLHDPDGAHTYDALAVDGLPTTFVVGRDGLVLEVHAGIADYGTAAALDHFRELLRR